MPPLGPDFVSPEDDRYSSILDKELAAAKLAHRLLRGIYLDPTSNCVSILGKIAHGSHTDVPTTTEIVTYDFESNGQTIPMAAFLSETGCLYTLQILGHDADETPQFGLPQPRARIRRNDCKGDLVVALDADCNEVPPSSMDLDLRKAFIEEVTETLTIIQDRSRLGSTVELQSSAL